MTKFKNVLSHPDQGLNHMQIFDTWFYVDINIPKQFVSSSQWKSSDRH
jgi:hypothetical protein